MKYQALDLHQGFLISGPVEDEKLRKPNHVPLAGLENPADPRTYRFPGLYFEPLVLPLPKLESDCRWIKFISVNWVVSGGLPRCSWILSRVRFWGPLARTKLRYIGDYGKMRSRTSDNNNEWVSPPDSGEMRWGRSFQPHQPQPLVQRIMVEERVSINMMDHKRSFWERWNPRIWLHRLLWIKWSGNCLFDQDTL